MVRVSQKVLESTCIRVFLGLGISSADGAVIARHLVDADLAGYSSHGVRRITEYIQAVREGKIIASASLDVVQENKTSAIFDAHWGFGSLAARKVAFHVATHTKEAGLYAATVRRLGHVGRLGPYLNLLAKENLIGLGMMNHHGGGQVMAPYGGIDRRLSPNPISISIPRRNQSPFLIDISFSAVAEGKLRLFREKQQQIPEGWIVNGHGKPSVQPEDFYRDPQGALLPFGGLLGYKSFGLALAVEMISGILSGAGCSREGETTVGNSLFLLGMKIEDFVPLESFYQQVEDLIHYSKSSRTQPGFNTIQIPGELETQRRREGLLEGIELPDDLWVTLKGISEKSGASETNS